MFPIKAEQLALTDIADYWAREIKPRATQAELLTTLAKAWFGGELKSAGRQNRLDLLRAMFKSTQDDLVFLVGDEPGPPEIRGREDGNEQVNMRPRVKVPSSAPINWTEEKCSEAFAAIADKWDGNWNIEQVQVYAPLTKVTHAEFHKWLGASGFEPITFWAQPKHSVDTDDRPVVPLGKLRKWYVEDYIPQMEAERQSPGFHADLEAANKQFEGYKVTQRPLIEIRAKNAPVNWKSTKKPKLKKRKTQI